MAGIWLPHFPVPISPWAAGAEAPGRCHELRWGCAAGSLGTWLPPSQVKPAPYRGSGQVLGLFWGRAVALWLG